jgi:hypothetical protein
MNTLLLSFLISYLPLLILTHELNEETAFLLTCPIAKESDLNFIYSLAEKGHPIDVFQENVLLDQNTIIQLLTDEATSAILLSHSGCHEEKSRTAVKKIFNSLPSPPAPPQIGLEFHDNYRSYQNILDQLAYYANKYPSTVKLLKSIGKSHEGRDLSVIHITAPQNILGSKPLIWLMAGQHAREWIATAAAMFFIEQLLQNQEILKDYEFAVLPLVNPDGYEYSRDVNRMWRKNRRPVVAVDTNRNWDHRWCEIGSSRNENSDLYCGPSAASEPEVRATQNYILSLPNRAIAFDVHSYSQLILRNYGWTRSPSPLEPILLAISNQMSTEMKSLYNVLYTPKLSSGLYPSSGSAEDWLYVKAGIPGFILELRDKGRYGFHLPRSQIKPTGRELYVGILAAIKPHNISKFIPKK